MKFLLSTRKLFSKQVDGCMYQLAWHFKENTLWASSMTIRKSLNENEL